MVTPAAAMTSTWKMNRMNAHRPPLEKVEDETIPARINALMHNGTTNPWENNFLQSLRAGYEKYNSLTKGQYDTFVQVEKRYDAEAVEARNKWLKEWDESKAHNWKMMIKYYSGTTYYRGAVERANENTNYIPGEAEYKSVCENKYALKFLTQLTIPAKFNVGQLVVVKRWGSKKLGTIISVGDVSSWVKGSREYTVFVNGDSKTDTIVEKELTYYRPSLDAKLTLNDDVPF